MARTPKGGRNGADSRRGEKWRGLPEGGEKWRGLPEGEAIFLAAAAAFPLQSLGLCPARPAYSAAWLAALSARIPARRLAVAASSAVRPSGPSTTP